MEPKDSSREEIADNESPLAQALIVMYGRIVLIYMKCLLLRLLLLEFDFEKKKIILPSYCRLHNAFCILWSGHSVPAASHCFLAADKVVPFVSPCPGLTPPFTLPSTTFWCLNFSGLSRHMRKIWRRI